VQVITQTLDQILASLRPLTVEWEDEVAQRLIKRLKDFPIKTEYTEADVSDVLNGGPFEDGLLLIRLFLGLSKDQFSAVLRNMLGEGGMGVNRFKADPARFLAALLTLGVLQAISSHTSREPHWSDVLVERLRSGRGSAISGQRRGRGVEDFVEAVVRNVFGDAFEMRVTFVGRRGMRAKCDFAIPSRDPSRILIEAKGYGATGSKMSDVIGDIEQIIASKRGDTTFLFFTDGVTWNQRQSDLRKIIHFQNNGDIARIYTYSMAQQFESDLRQLKSEYNL
jgi:hypothetical protein